MRHTTKLQVIAGFDSSHRHQTIASVSFPNVMDANDAKAKELARCLGELVSDARGEKAHVVEVKITTERTVIV